jgi:hypothetical protein
MIALALLAAVSSSTLPPAGERFIRQRLNLDSYRSATADLNGDRRPEILVYTTDPDDCGSGGCVLYVLSPRADTYRIVMRATIVQLPIRLLATKSHGWRDIGVTVRGGGILNAYMARLRFNGHRYPSTPRVPPAIAARPSGKVLIAP